MRRSPSQVYTSSPNLWNELFWAASRIESASAGVAVALGTTTAPGFAGETKLGTATAAGLAAAMAVGVGAAMAVGLAVATAVGVEDGVAAGTVVPTGVGSGRVTDI